MELTHLFSLLGGMPSERIDASAVDSALTNGLYYLQGNVAVGNTTVKNGLLKIDKATIGTLGTWVYQHLYSATDGLCFYRLTVDGGSNWRGWYRLDNFGCNTISDLASALGVNFKSYLTDVNTVNQPGLYVYHIDEANWPSNLPGQWKYGTFISIITPPSYRFGMQIYFTSNSDFYVRYAAGSANSINFWPWKKVQVNSL